MNKNNLRSLAAGCLAMVPALLMGSAARAQRIAQGVALTAAAPVALRGQISPRAKAAVDMGLVTPDTSLESVSLRFNQTPAQTAALEQLLADQQNRNSPSYHQWLTPEQFGQRFGLSSADLATVSTWLQAKGLKVTSIARSRTFITFSGSAAQVQAAFQTPIHQLNANGTLHYGNLTAPTLPPAIASVVAGITGLNDFRPRPHNRVHTEAAPRFTSSISGSHFIAPGDFYTIYDINPLLNSSINGSGVTIAVMGQVAISQTDVAAFQSASGLPAKAPTVKLYGPAPTKPTSDDTIEAQLDVEWSGAVAQGANILYVYSDDAVDTSLVNAIDNDVAPIITISYGNCESQFGGVLSFNSVFQQANAQGQTVVSAAGDSGATDCDYQVSIASGGLAVDYPGSSPNVTSLGGSMFNEGGGTYFNSSNGAYSGSALSYIPEAVWNETTSSQLSAGGGGASNTFAKPAWQVGVGVPQDSARDVPDVVLNSAAAHDGYLICASGSCTNGYRDASNNLEVVGGTSVAAPTFAGVLALMEQKLGARVGNANPVIYGLANSTYSSAVFHDITTGNNKSPCKAGTTGCPSGGSLGYNAGTGYDLATGWGSIDGFNFVNDWALVQPAGSSAGQNASATSLIPANSTVSVGTSVSYTAAVASGTTGVTTTPTGTIQLLLDNVAAGSAVTLTNGSATVNLSTAGVAAGSHTVTAVYSGDSIYATSKATASLTTTAAAAARDFTLSPATASATATSGGAAPGLSFSVAGVNGFAGNVTLSAVATTAVAASYSFSVNPVVISSAANSGITVLSLFAKSSAAGSGTSPLIRKGTSAARLHPAGQPWLPLGSGIAMAGFLLLGFPRIRRGRWSALAVAVLAAGMMTLSGCGSGTSTSSNTASSSSSGATPGTYTVNVTASGTDSSGKAISHTAAVTFIVQ